MMTLTNIFKAAAMAGFAVMLLACGDVGSIIPDGGNVSQTPDNAIVFSTPDNWGDDSPTRTISDDSGTSFIVGDKIGVYAYYTQAGTDGRAEFMMNEDVLKESSSWTYSPVKYWPANTNDKISFYGYYPHVEGRINPEAIEIDDAVTDWLWAEPVTNQKSGTVNLLFHHALAGIRLKVSCAEGMADVKVMSVSLVDSNAGLPYGGTLDIGTENDADAGKVTPSDTRVGSIGFPIGETPLSTVPVSTSIYIPTYTGIIEGQISLDFIFNVGGAVEKVSFILPSINKEEPKYPYSYNASRRYTYNLVLDEDKSVRITSITIADFEQEEPIDVVVGTQNE